MKDETKIEIAEKILAEISEWKYPADRVINKFMRENRSLNSKNRRFITSYIYEKLRQLEMPQWWNNYLPKGFDVAVMNQEAPLDLRVNTLKAKRENVKIDGAENTPLSPVGLRLKKRAPLQFDGSYEVQDEGSQLVVQYAAVKAGNRVLDYCAGAGGKALALAAEMGNVGQIIAYDINRERMKDLASRSKRAGATMVKLAMPEGEFDMVFVDAPCSGTGTWRRNPDLKFRFTEVELKKNIELQQEILNKASKFVQKGGKLVYVTCSVLECENESQIDNFLRSNPNFKIKKDFLKLAPPATDGFFAAVLSC